jgi:hypothetical protein
MRVLWKLPAVILVVIVLIIASFPVSIFADGPVGGYDEADFTRIAEDGLGDPMNNYAWSMAKFKGDVYVGTVRNLLYWVGVWFKQANVIPQDFELPVTRPEGAILSHQWAEDMRGEIWRYRHGAWTRVHQSGITPYGGGWAPEEPGYRFLTTFTDKWGEEALYASTGEADYLPQHLLLKSTDGTTWNRVVTPSGMGSDSRSMVVHNGKLYIAAKDATIWATDDPVTTGTGDNWEKVADVAAIGPGTNVDVVSMASFNGYLFAGTHNDSGFQLFRSNSASPQPGEWTQLINNGAGEMTNTWAMTMQTFKNHLYLGSAVFPVTSGNPPELRGPKGFELFRINTDDSWEMLVGDSYASLPPGDDVLRVPESGWPGGFGNILNYYCWSMQEKDGVLYLGTFDTSSFFKAVSADNIRELLDFYNITPENQEKIRQQMILSVQQAINSQIGLDLDINYQELLAILQNMSFDWEEVWSYMIDNFAGADLWKTRDGITWEPVTLNGFDNPYNYGIRTMLNGSLYVGTANPFQGFEVLRAQYVMPDKVSVVGGDVEPVNKTTAIIPWAALALAIITLGVFWGLSRRRTS